MKLLREDDRKPAAERSKKEPEDEAQSWAQDEQKEEPTFKPWEDKKDYEAIFRKYISIGEDGEEHYEVIDMEREDHPNDHRLVGCRWVFKVKRNGVYHARLVAKGFSQIPGMAFTDNYSPVVNDVTFRVVVARMLIENLKGKVVDIDNAFLNGDLEHEIYMKIPEGYDEVINQGVHKEHCLIMQKAIYGLVQAARQFWKKIVDKMQEGGFKLSEADSCMLYKENEKGSVSS